MEYVLGIDVGGTTIKLGLFLQRESCFQAEGQDART